MEIVALQQAISSKMASNILKKKAPSIQIKSFDTVYYPYFRIIATIKTKLLTRKIDGNVSCLIDLVNGAEALTGEICDKQTIEVDDNKVLNISVDIEEAKKKSLKFVRHMVMHKMKILKIPRIDLSSVELFYKPFWIIECESTRKNCTENFYLLMDSISGDFHLLQP